MKRSPDKMSRRKAEKRAKNLREEIEHHDYLYYVKNRPKISDAEYDRLFEQLEKIENRYPSLKTGDSPTQKVGGEVQDKLKKVRHKSAMLSLRSSREEKEIRKFTNDNSGQEFILEPKYDGFSIEVVYEKGRFRYAATRGDGQTGEDISANAKTIGPLPLKLKRQETISVRGEVFLPKSAFTKINKERVEKGKEAFANPRNAAAGMMRQLDPNKVAPMPFDIVFYELLKGAGKEDHEKTLEWLRSLGLKTGRHNSKAKELKGAKRYHEEMIKKRDSIEYEIDGIVIKINDYRTRQELGVRQRNPKWAIAWKFPPKQEKTRILDITVQVGRTGMLTPVALLSPVDIGGVTVSRATLHNEDYVKKHDFRKNDIVKLKRAGDVIPEVVSRQGSSGKRGKRFSMPKRCPACRSSVIKEGAYYFCGAGLRCPAQLKGHIMHFASRAAMDIEGIGDKVAEMITDLDLVSDISGLYTLKKEDLKKLEGFSSRSAEKLYSQIQDARQADLDRFLYSLGIRHVGEHIARVVAARFSDIEEIRNAKKNDFESAEEIGPQIAESLEAFFKKNKTIVDSLLQEIDVKGTKKRKNSSISGRTFVFTGSLESFMRNDAKRAVEKAGARASSTVSKNTDYVVAGENPGSKLDQAKEHDVKIISEKDFKKMIGGG